MNKKPSAITLCYWILMAACGIAIGFFDRSDLAIFFAIVALNFNPGWVYIVELGEIKTLAEELKAHLEIRNSQLKCEE